MKIACLPGVVLDQEKVGSGLLLISRSGFRPRIVLVGPGKEITFRSTRETIASFSLVTVKSTSVPDFAEQKIGAAILAATPYLVSSLTQPAN